jgi:hypothetical protein
VVRFGSIDFSQTPHADLKRILGTQKIIRTLLSHVENGHLKLQRDYSRNRQVPDYNLDPISDNQNPISTLSYKWFHREDYAMVKYSMRHFADFYRGIKNLAQQFNEQTDLPLSFKIYIERIHQLLKETPLHVCRRPKKLTLSVCQNLYFGFHLRGHYKTDTLELIEIFYRLDAWYSMPWP